MSSAILQNARNFSIHDSQFNSVQGDQYNSFSYHGSQSTTILEEIIGRMSYSPQAFYDADNGIQYSRKVCFPGTREQILSDIERWAINPQSDVPLGYWMCGMAGTGKSTIAMSLCTRLEHKGLLAGTFFCSRQIPECRNHCLVIPTLAYQLAKYSEIFATSLRNALQKDPDLAVKDPGKQIKTLLIAPWRSAMNGETAPYPPVLILDALDECENVSLVLKPLISAIQDQELPGLKFFLTSRPEQAILQLMHPSPMSSIPRVKEFILHQVEDSFVQQDIYTYVKAELSKISPSEEQLQTLKELSGALFIYASTVVKFVKGVSSHTKQQARLTHSLKQGNNPEDIKQLYAGIMNDAISAEGLSYETEDDWMIIYAIITAGKPLTCNAIAELLEIEVDLVIDLIARLQAVCYISDQNNCIFTFHASFPDFITTFKQVEGIMYIPASQHLKLTLACFTVMEQLRFNICNLPSSFIPDKEVFNFDGRIEENIGEALQYSCQFWSYHFLQSEFQENGIETLKEFLKAKGVYWIEAMSLLGLLPNCGEAINSMHKKLLHSYPTSEATSILQYLRNLLIQFSSGEVRGRTPHLYLSIIPFWENDLECKPQVKRSLRIEARAQNRITDIILKGHKGDVTSVAFSTDGTRIVSGSQDKTIKIWDATTGAQIGDPLKGHKKLVLSVAFSPDGSRIVSGSLEHTIRIWDANTGAQIGDPLKGHGHSVWSVAFSPDGTRIVSGSHDHTIRIWDAITGAQIGDPLEGHGDSVQSVVFSPDGTRIVSGSCDNTIRIWDATMGAQIGDPLEGHGHSIWSVAFSHDGTRIVSGSGDYTIRIWDAAMGAQIGDALEGHGHWVQSVAFSPDGTRIVSGSDDHTIRIWDATTGAQIGDPLEGHQDSVQSVAFSPDGTRILSGSDDHTIRIWDATTDALIGDALEGHQGSVRSVAFSPDGTRIVSGSDDHKIRIWDATTGAQIVDPLKGHEHSVWSVAFSPDGTRIVSGSDDRTIRIWDATTGTQIGDPLEGHEDSVWSVAFSHNGTRIVSGSDDHKIRIWDATTGAQIVDPLEGHEDSVWSVAFSHNGTRIVSGSDDHKIRIWDAQIVDPLEDDPLEGHGHSVWSVAFSPDGTRIVSGSDDRTIRIWDATTGTQIGDPLEGHEDSVWSVAFSHNGTRIVSGSDDCTIRIWDATTDAQIGDALEGHQDSVFSVAFSPDGTRIVSGSGDHTIRIWDATMGTQIGDPLEGHQDSVQSVAFSPDGTRIVSGSDDHTIRIWDVNTEFPICNTHIHHHQSFQAHNSWHLSSDGWIFFPNLPHGIIWIPPQFRKALCRPQNPCIISRKGHNKISLEDCVYGEEWFRCIED